MTLKRAYSPQSLKVTLIINKKKLKKID